jgi:hypothetical protein
MASASRAAGGACPRCGGRQSAGGPGTGETALGSRRGTASGAALAPRPNALGRCCGARWGAVVLESSGGRAATRGSRRSGLVASAAPRARADLAGGPLGCRRGASLARRSTPLGERPFGSSTWKGPRPNGPPRTEGGGPCELDPPPRLGARSRRAGRSGLGGGPARPAVREGAEMCPLAGVHRSPSSPGTARSNRSGCLGAAAGRGGVPDSLPPGRGGDRALHRRPGGRPRGGGAAGACLWRSYASSSRRTSWAVMA